ncbi:MAG: RNA polymerase sigma factor [Eudoraea sp.]|nr:RNA polymerase sigma factor [Eudoraea sp.]
MFQIDLVERCRKNDRKAQLKLYKQYCEGMYCVAARFLNNADDAEDVLQEAFIKAFQKIHQFSGEVTFGAWLKRIVINTCIDYLKSKKMQFVEFQDYQMQVVEDEDWSVSESVSLDEVKKAMEQLPEKYCYVVKLYLLEGYDHTEIAQILKLTQTASRTRLLRGKAYLRELLKEKNHGTGS